MKIITSRAAAILLCGFVTFASGCSTAGLNMNMFSESHEKESAENFVEQVIPVWQEAEGGGLKQNSVSKGFGGQIYFITRNRGLPSEVNGSVRIYVFDDQGTPEEQAKPIHQFDFPAESWKGHLSMSKLGPSYSVFIPYTRAGGRMANCALRIRYTPEKGTPVFSQMVSITMSGSNPNGEAEDQAKKISIPELTKRGPSSRKITQISATGGLQHQQRVQNLGYEAPARQKRSANAGQRNSRPALGKPNSLSAKEAFMGSNPDDLPADEESVEELLSDDPDLDVTASDEETDGAVEDEGERTMRTYTIPLGN